MLCALDGYQVNLFHCGLTLAGQPDLLMKDADGSVVVVDWKRSRDVRFENDRRSLRYPVSHLPDSNGWLYCLQLNVYRYLLESEYGFTVSGMFLAVVHPESEAPRLIACPRMQAEVDAIVEYEIECGRARAAALPGANAPFVVS